MRKISSLSEREIILFFIIINIIFKFQLLFINVFPSDVIFYYATGWLLINDVLPYESFSLYSIDVFEVFLNSPHPNGPFNYLFYSFILLTLGESTFAIKFPWFIAEILITLYIYKIGSLFTNKERSFIAALTYTCCIPCFYPGILLGCDELITGALALMGLYYFFVDRNFLAGLLLGLAISYKLYPVLFFPSIFLYCFHKKKIKFFIQLVSISILTILIVALPYLLLIPDIFFISIFGQANRFITVSYGYYIRDSWFYQPLIEISPLFLNITPHFLFELLIVGGYALYDFLYSMKTKMYKIDVFFRAITFYVLILPVVSLSFNYRYTQWLIPLLILFLILRNRSGGYLNMVNDHLDSNIVFKKSFPFLYLAIIILNLIISIVYLVQLKTKDYTFNPFGVYVFNNYLFTFLMAFLAYLIISYIYFDKGDFLYQTALIGFLQSTGAILLYYSLQTSGKITQIEIILVTISFCIIIISIIYALWIIFQPKKRE